MENVIDIRMALDQMGAGWKFGGSVTDGTQESWEDVGWEDERGKPSWDDLRAAHAKWLTKTTILENIAALESQQTPRRLREAALSDNGRAWLQNLEDQIVAKRAELAGL